MKVALIGASGRVGICLTHELVRRGHEVTGISRHPEGVPDHPHVTAKRGDLFDQPAMASLLAGHDAVISTVLFLQSDPDRLIGAVRDSGVKRYIVVGGAGSLEVAPGVRLIDAPDFPPDYLPEASRGAAFLDALRKVDDLEWTFLSPSLMFWPGERTGTFRLGQDTLLIGPDGQSVISFEDYVIALVDELEQPRHVHARFTVGY